MSKSMISIFLVLLLALGTGCSRLPELWSNFSDSDTKVDFVIDNIGDARQSGGVSLRGTASLPNGTEVTVSALRILDAPDESFVEGTLYAILDRQFVEVEDSQWQTNLSLRQPDVTNSGFESWQFSDDLRLNAISPSQNVVFLAMIEPRSFSGEVGEILTNATINEGDTQLEFTSNGEPYLQVSQSMTVPIPSGTATKRENEFLQVQYQDIWQERSNYSPRVDSLEATPPLPFMEEDNLPLPIANQLQ